ncbi:MAG TPA: hypothetical protein VH476_04330 [Solirubrobacterales bacterium]
MKRLILGLVLAGLLALAVPSSAPAAATYNLFAGCDAAAENPQPSHTCLTTDHMAAYFEASEETEYEVCLFRNVVEELDCSTPTVAEADTRFKNSFAITMPGKYELVWFNRVTESEIGEWDLAVESPPPPPPPPVVTPPPAAPLPSPVNTACLSGQKRVTALRAKVKRAHGRRQKAKLKAKLRKARAAVKAAC